MRRVPSLVSATVVATVPRRHVALVASVLAGAVAVEDDVVVGHIAFSPVTITRLDASGLAGIGLGPMAVTHSRQGCGIGTRLVKTGLERLRAHRPSILRGPWPPRVLHALRVRTRQPVRDPLGAGRAGRSLLRARIHPRSAPGRLRRRAILARVRDRLMACPRADLDRFCRARSREAGQELPPHAVKARLAPTKPRARLRLRAGPRRRRPAPPGRAHA